MLRRKCNWALTKLCDTIELVWNLEILTLCSNYDIYIIKVSFLWEHWIIQKKYGIIFSQSCSSCYVIYVSLHFIQNCFTKEYYKMYEQIICNGTQMGSRCHLASCFCSELADNRNSTGSVHWNATNLPHISSCLGDESTCR